GAGIVIGNSAGHITVATSAEVEAALDSVVLNMPSSSIFATPTSSTVGRTETINITYNTALDGSVMAWDTPTQTWVARSGSVSGTIYYGYLTQQNSGTGTVTIGRGASTLTSTEGVAVGYTSSATGNQTVAIDSLAVSSGIGSVAIG